MNEARAPGSSPAAPAEVIEHELKLDLGGEEGWATARQALFAGARHQGRAVQTNTYFDTPDGRIRRDRRAMIRIREASGDFELTAKDRVTSGATGQRSRERTEALTEPLARALLAGRVELAQSESTLGRALVDEWGPLHPWASMVNTRDSFELSDGYVAELDLTELPGGRLDAEIELELRRPDHSPAGALTALRQAWPDLPECTAATPKFQRFLEAVAARDELATNAPEP